jgi:FMN phosphatase YigB (HAD superfamily)
MSGSSPETVPQTTLGFSPFPAVFALFLVFSAAQAIYLYDALQNRAEIRAASAALNRDLPRAREILETLDKVGRDLLVLSNAKSSEAARIVGEFNIQLTGTPEPVSSAR